MSDGTIYDLENNLPFINLPSDEKEESEDQEN